jgi:DNA-binding response OmpR family regulator
MTTILVVDDSLTVRMDLAEALAAAGFEVVPVATLAEARTALTGSISCVILDVVLPDGDGVTLLGEIRDNPTTAALPVLLLSTEAEVKDRIRGLKTGANDYIGKPYDTAFLIARIREVVGGDSTTRTILVIDDSQTYRMMLSESLGDAGYTTVTADNGSEGLKLATVHVPAAIIVDGVMPDMDGTTVIRKIRLDPALRTIPCVLLTGSEGNDAELRALDAGADAFVRKEADIEVILARVSAVLRAAPNEPQRPVAPGLKRLLCVDDSPTYLNELGDQLRAEGYDVVLATSGEEALELIAVQHVDCILLDRTMPGLSGPETCARIKSAPVIRDIPLLMLTAHDDRASMIEGLSAGADDFVSKAAGIEVLKARVQAQLRRKIFEDEHRHAREQQMRAEREAEEARAANELAETRAAMTEQVMKANEELAAANRELESFSYSVSHDLRAPLRAINGFASVLAEDYGPQLDDAGKKHLERIVSATQRMDAMITDMLRLARVASGELFRKQVDVTEIVEAIAADLALRDPDRKVEMVIAPNVSADADAGMLRTALENLLGNAWKFTRNRADARIEFGVRDQAYFVADNGAGFNMTAADKLFRPFQRLHSASEFEGTGIGLATVQRVISRHQGKIWATGVKGEGATFFFTL